METTRLDLERLQAGAGVPERGGNELVSVRSQRDVTSFVIRNPNQDASPAPSGIFRIITAER